MTPQEESAARATPIVRFAVQRRVTTSMIVLGVLVLGWISLQRIPLEYLPSFSASNITVTAPYRSSSPEEVERLIVRPLEDSLGTINGIETLSASAAAEQAQIRISFIDGTDMDMAAVDIRDRIDRVRYLLPGDLERVYIRRFQSTDIPVQRFDLSADWPVEKLYDFAETFVQRRLERLDGVAQVSIEGLRTPELQVNLNPSMLLAHGIDLRAVVAVLRDNNVDVSAGDIRERSRKLQVRTIGHIGSLEEARRLPLNAAGLRLSDVAEVCYGFPEKEEFNFLNGAEALTVAVNKAFTANVLKVADLVRSEMDSILRMPEAEGLSYRIFQDASIDVRRGLGQLGNSYLVMASQFESLLHPLVILFSVPFASIGVLATLFITSTAISVVVLIGVILMAGIVVNNAIILIDYTNTLRAGGMGRIEALMKAGAVRLRPIMMTTATTILGLLPMALGLGEGSELRAPMAITVIGGLTTSTLLTLSIIPAVYSLVDRGR